MNWYDTRITQKGSWFLTFGPQAYSGSRRTFNALLKSMLTKNKIGLALVLVRRNATPVFCALLPQVSHKNPLLLQWTEFDHIFPERASWGEWLHRRTGYSFNPASFCRWYPCCSNSRSFPRYGLSPHYLWESFLLIALASDDLKDAARAWIDKLSVKNGTYPPDSYPNPGK